MRFLDKFFLRNFPKRGILVDESGIVEQQVGRTVALEKPLRPAADLVIVRDINSLEIMRLAVRLPQFFDGGIGSAAA